MKNIFSLYPDGSLARAVEVVDGKLLLNDGKSIAEKDVFWLPAPNNPRIEVACLNAETLENVLAPLPCEVSVPRHGRFIVLQREYTQ